MQSNEKNPNGLQLFHFGNSPIRIILQVNGEPLFVAIDVCQVLGLDNVSMAVKRLDDDEKLTSTLLMSGQNREVFLINESGLYSLILTSRKTEAKIFKKWVTSEVLPTIRKTGSYSLPQKSTFEMLAEGFAQMAELEKANSQTNARIDKIEAKVSSINTEYYTLSGYYNLNKWRWNMNPPESQKVGKDLTYLSGVMGYEVLKQYDAKFGQINSYNEAVLKTYFEVKK